MLENLKRSNEDIVNETVPAVVSMTEVQRVLRNLLREGVPILDLEAILETMSDYAPTVKDSDLLTEYVRQSLRRTITHHYADGGQLKVLSLDNSVEDVVMRNLKKIEGGAYLNLEPDMIQNIMGATKTQIDSMRRLVQEPIILTSPIVRVYFKKLLDQFYPNITVLSFNDIDTGVQIQALGNISIAS